MPVLTAKLIAAAVPPATGQKFLFDQHRDAPRGFGLRLTAAGGRAFVIQYRTPDGRQRRLTIGDARHWTLGAARDEARALRLAIDRGHDPLDERQKEKTPAAITVAELLKVYNPTSDQQRRYLTRDWLAAHGDRPVAELRRRDIVELVEAKAIEAPVAARQLLSAIKCALDRAVALEHVEMNVARTVVRGTLEGVKNPGRRERTLTDAEICRLWAAPATPANNVLRLILLTGQRPGEARGPVGNEVVGDIWTIPAERRKTRVEHAVPLPPLALTLVATHTPVREAVLASAAAALDDPERWPSKAAGSWRPHDLRRTCRTRLAEVGVSEVVAERVIGHAVQGIVAVYDRHSYAAEMREALERWYARLREIVSSDPRAGEDG